MSSHNFLNELGVAHNSTTGDFIKDVIPEKLQDDYFVVYMRARFSEQNKIKAAIAIHGNEEEKIRFEKELGRIERLREAFFANPENVPIIELFEYRRALWRQHAVGKREDSEIDIKDRSNRNGEFLQMLRNGRTQESQTRLQSLEEEEISEAKAPKSSFWARFRKGQNQKSEGDDVPKRHKAPAKEKGDRKRLPDFYGITVSKITLRKSGVCKSFYMSPETKFYSLNDVLFKEGEENLLTQKCEDDAIRYFHIPANNMHWVEEAIARYYGEKTPGEFNYRKDPKYLKRSSNILCREFWSSRQHGGIYGPVHARHMRLHCSLIMPQTKGTSEPGVENKNFVIFCSTVFFDSTKSVDERPELLDIFANVFSYITLAFETFWYHFDKMSASDRQLAGSELIAKSYLNINLEGELLREAHDIIEELRIMMRIFTHQLSVTDLFSEHLAALHDKRCKPAPDEALDVLKDIKALLQRQSEGGETVSVATSNCHAIKDEVQRINEIINENATTLSSSTAHLNAISPQESKVLKPPPDIPETTISLSERVRDHMMSRRGKLQELEEQTIIIAEQLKDLLSLKQQQASIIEAKCASKSAEETAIQGRSIMLFTIITIDKAESLNRCRDASRCPGLSDVDTSGGSLHRSRGRLASLFFSIKRLTVTQGNGFGNDGDLDAMEKGEWNCLPSSKKAT
ncbi:hypothetical protein B0O99DRAFT_684012 [Bisporella sp. PMI_857]|nr:hypothetical protein B0O99DRAFT_684012 [Bisporella sp. PMI_857]